MTAARPGRKTRGNRRHRALHAAVRAELLNLWSDMRRARRAAIQGCWSMDCEEVERRIKALTPFVGPPDWRRLDIEMLEQGIYQGIHADLGYTVTPDMAVVAELRAQRDAAVAEYSSPEYQAWYEADKRMRQRGAENRWSR